MAVTDKKKLPTKGAGTFFFRMLDDKEATALTTGTLTAAEVKKTANWGRIAKIKELSIPEVSAETYEDNYLDDENAEWKASSQGAKNAGELSVTLAWLPGDDAQKKLIEDFNTGKKKYYLVQYPNGTRDVFYGFITSLGKTVPQNEVMTRTIKVQCVGKPMLAETDDINEA
ncbi:phage tail protein [Pasteurellaceae bacterium TAE3-ERU1]|nr:phage tail protein [Pasteurellaceae bacterium TAE3-ERU1]